jgi:hypothetical protein
MFAALHVCDVAYVYMIYICSYKALHSTLTKTWHVNNQKHDAYNNLVDEILVTLAAQKTKEIWSFLFNPLKLGIPTFFGKWPEFLQWAGSRATHAQSTVIGTPNHTKYFRNFCSNNLQRFSRTGQNVTDRGLDIQV